MITQFIEIHPLGKKLQRQVDPGSLLDAQSPPAKKQYVEQLNVTHLLPTRYLSKR